MERLLVPSEEVVEVLRTMMRVTREKKLLGNRSVTVFEGDLVEQMDPPDEDGLVNVRTASGETGHIKIKYLGNT